MCAFSLTVLLGPFKERSNGSQISFMSEEQGLNFTLQTKNRRCDTTGSWANS